MSLFAGWHRRWLLDYLGRNPGDFFAAPIGSTDGWRGWATGELIAAGESPNRLRRALDAWHMRWVLAEVDIRVATGQWEFREEAGAIVVRCPDEPSP